MQFKEVWVAGNAWGNRLRSRLDQYLRDLALLSGMDCGTYDKAGVDAVGGVLRARLEALGATVETHGGGDMGNSLVAHLTGRGGARVMLLGHLDTVYARGWPAEHPFHIEGDRAFGPGTADMKGGLLAGLYALEALLDSGDGDFGEIVFVLNSDEEIGSPSSRELIEREARGRDAVLVLEPGRENGDIVSARKGLAALDLSVSGRAAHAGVEIQKGRNAVLELAHQIVALQALNDPARGVSVNVGVAQGGTRRNVVPAEADAQVDVRAFDRAALDATVASIYQNATRVTVPDTIVTVHGGISHGPMEKTAATERLLEWCRAAALDAGFELRDAATGGGSDGNTTAALGVPTLDGLGPVGGRAHSPDEYIEIPSIVPRIAMLAGLISRIKGDS